MEDIFEQQKKHPECNAPLYLIITEMGEVVENIGKVRYINRKGWIEGRKETGELCAYLPFCFTVIDDKKLAIFRDPGLRWDAIAGMQNPAYIDAGDPLGPKTGNNQALNWNGTIIEGPPLDVAPLSIAPYDGMPT